MNYKKNRKLKLGSFTAHQTDQERCKEMLSHLKTYFLVDMNPKIVSNQILKFTQNPFSEALNPACKIISIWEYKYDFVTLYCLMRHICQFNSCLNVSFQASVKNFQLCHHSSPDYIIMQVDHHHHHPRIYLMIDAKKYFPMSIHFDFCSWGALKQMSSTWTSGDLFFSR